MVAPSGRTVRYCSNCRRRATRELGWPTDEQYSIKNSNGRWWRSRPQHGTSTPGICEHPLHGVTLVHWDARLQFGTHRLHRTGCGRQNEHMTTEDPKKVTCPGCRRSESYEEATTGPIHLIGFQDDRFNMVLSLCQHGYGRLTDQKSEITCRECRQRINRTLPLTLPRPS